jgi:replicative DNA helicase
MLYPVPRHEVVERLGQLTQESTFLEFSELDLMNEKVLLGTLITMGAENLPEALDVGLVPEDFYREAHQEIYSAIADLYNRNEMVDSLTLSNRLKSRGSYEKVGTEVYLSDLEASAVVFRATKEYAKYVVDRAAVRRLKAVGLEIAEKCASVPGSVDELLNDVEAAVCGIRDRRCESNLFFLPETLSDVYQRIAEVASLQGRLSGVPTGYAYLDRLTGGFQKSDMIVLGGRPGMGKTAITLNLALNAAMPWRREAYQDMGAFSVMFFSMEMSREQIVMRILCQLSRIDLLKMRSYGLSPQEMDLLTQTINELHEAPIYIDDTSGKKTTPLELRAKARRLMRLLDRGKLPPLGLIIVDYLQLMTPDEKHSNREREVAEISASLKSLAKELNIAVLCCSQLKRSDDGAPELSDLRDSGAIEQDADIVAFILRKEVLHPDKPEYEGKAELQIKKHRNGPTGVLHLNFLKHCSCFLPSTFQDFDDQGGGAPAGT